MTLTRRLHLLIVVPLLALTLAVGWISARGMANNNADLEELLQVQASANRAFALLLVQEDASKAILIDPNRLADYSAAKLAAYDEHKKLLRELDGRITDPAVAELLDVLEKLDTETLRPLDTRILEQLFEDPAVARRLYFEEYEPNHAAYEATIRRMVDGAEGAVSSEGAAVRRKNLTSLGEILGVMFLGTLTVAITIQVLGGRVEQVNADLRSLLRGMDEGMFSFDAKGGISRQRSQALAEILPDSDGIESIYTFVERYSGLPRENVETCLALLWASEDDGFYSPFEATITFLPSVLQLPGDRVVRLQYKAGFGPAGVLERVYVNARDVTEQLRTEQEARLQAERAHRIGLAASNPEAFLSFQQEIGDLLAIVKGELGNGSPAIDVLKRHLHTIKGSTGTSGFRGVSRRVHDLEEELGVAGCSEGFRASVAVMATQFEAECHDVREVLGIERAIDIRWVSSRKLAALVGAVRVRGDAQLLESVEDLDRRPIGDLLVRHRRYLLDLSERRQELAPNVVFEEGSAEISQAEVEPVDAILSHLLRNAVDHGLEAPALRDAAGKPRAGTIRIACRRDSGKLVWTVTDDGRGIPVDDLARKMVTLGLWNEQQATTASWDEKVALAFLPGLSSQGEATETSGRGIGMDAVRRHVEALGGQATLTTEPGTETRVTLVLPTIDARSVAA